MSTSMSMLHVCAHAACSHPFCMSIYMSMLHVHVHDKCPCPCCMCVDVHAMSMLHACPCPCCLSGCPYP
jgi:hypothetical protein